MTMEAWMIKPQEQLQRELKTLRTERDVLESRLAKRLAALHAIAENPVPYLKKTIKELAADKEVDQDLLKAGLRAAVNYAVDRYIPDNRESFFSGLLTRLRGNRNSYATILGSLLKWFERR